MHHTHINTSAASTSKYNNQLLRKGRGRRPSCPCALLGKIDKNGCTRVFLRDKTGCSSDAVAGGPPPIPKQLSNQNTHGSGTCATRPRTMQSADMQQPFSTSPEQFYRPYTTTPAYTAQTEHPFLSGHLAGVPSSFYSHHHTP